MGYLLIGFLEVDSVLQHNTHFSATQLLNSTRQFSIASNNMRNQPRNKQKQPQQSQSMIMPQCKCKDVQRCSKEISKIAEKCKLEPKCDGLLKKIGDSKKIRSCLEAESLEMDKLEQCVEKKIGPIGCTNDEHPKNLTVSMASPMNAMYYDSEKRKKRSASPPSKLLTTTPNPSMQLPTQEIGKAPRELSDFLMCVDECTNMIATAQQTTDSSISPPKLCDSGDGAMNCAFKLKCAFAPPPENAPQTFEQCEKSLGLTGPIRLKKSCECLKAAGIKIVCPK